MNDIPSHFEPLHPVNHNMGDIRALSTSSVNSRDLAGGLAPAHTYTLGFQELFGCPDILIMGVRVPVATALLHAVFETLRDGKPVSLKEGTVCDLSTGDIGANLWKVKYAKISDADAATIAQNGRMATRRKKMRMVQMLLPDPRGRFPGEKGCDPLLQSSQNARRLAQILTDSGY